METQQVENRRVHRALGLVTARPMIWKPAVLKVVNRPRRVLDKWIAGGKFPKPDGVKFGHPWWYVATIEAWQAEA